MRREVRLVGLFSDPYCHRPQQEEVRRILSGPLDGSWFLARLKKEGVIGLAYYHLKAFELLPVLPAFVQEELAQGYYRLAARNAFLTEKIKPLLQSSRSENFPLIILKGISLCHDVYPNIALRPVTDVDVLIREEDRMRAPDFLKRLGYRFVFDSRKRLLSNHKALNSHVYTAQDGGFSLHLHWHLVNLSWPIETALDSVDMDGVWKEARRISIDGEEALALSAPHLLSYLVWHVFTHGVEHLIWLSDIAAVIEKYGVSFEKSFLRGYRKTYGLSFFADEILSMTGRILGRDVSGFFSFPGDLPKTLFQKLLVSLFRRDVRLSLLSYAALLSLQPGLRQKAGFLWKTKAGRFLSLTH